jgi:hypothetical protein
MGNQKKYLHYLLFVGFLLSCEKEIPYDTTNFEKKMAVQSLVENGIVQLSVSQNYSPLSSETIVSLKNAEVLMNGIIIDERSTLDPDVYTKLLKGVKPGDELNLSVSYNGLPSINAQAIIPQKPGFKILSSRIVNAENTEFSYPFSKYIELKVELEKNDVYISDYYIIELIKTRFVHENKYNPATLKWEKTELKKYAWPVYFYTKDNTAEIVGSGLAFRFNKSEFSIGAPSIFPTEFIISDKTFNGIHKVFTFITDLHDDYDYFEFRVSAINQGYYEFIQSVAAYNFNSGMFNEPVRIKSNINGGFGYFGIKTTVIDSIKISDIK